jgi:hypothetical protein
MKAYFNGGRIFTLDVNEKPTLEKMQAAVHARFPALKDDEVKALADKMIAAATGMTPDGDVYHLVVRDTKSGFVTRSGAKYVFPGISVTISPLANASVEVAKVDLVQVGADMVRVLIEATGDAYFHVPGDAGSTGVAAKVIDSYQGKTPQVPSPDDVAVVESWAAQAEAIAGTAVGQVIRGGGWVSLNNEAVAKLIETAVAVAARKGTEKTAWCVVTCVPEPAKRTAATQAVTATLAVQ